MQFSKQKLPILTLFDGKGERTNHVQNGLQLRADLHRVFDQGLIAFDTSAYEDANPFCASLLHPNYWKLNTAPLKDKPFAFHRPDSNLTNRGQTNTFLAGGS